MADSYWESSSSSVREVGGLSLALWAWRITGELLDFRTHRKLKKVVLSVKECNHDSSGLDEFPERVRASKRRAELFFFHILFPGLPPADAVTRRCHSQLGLVLPFKIIWLRSSLTGVPVNSPFSWFYILSIWLPGLAITGGQGHLNLMFLFSVWLLWRNLFFFSLLMCLFNSPVENAWLILVC